MVTPTIIAIIAFILSVVLIPWIIILLPSDYFAYPKRKKYPWEKYPPLIKWSILLLKNMLGAIFIIAGIVMLFIPGQGLLTIIAGLVLINFPHKYRIQKWVIRQPVVFKAINAIRRKAGRKPLQLPKKR
ncbi:MAG: PGPGW domain-containing protein [Dysgonamonadaceae bacterium]|nr:PGPGW domain-containing protein [Dysgonamonadaceae bacterium]